MWLMMVRAQGLIGDEVHSLATRFEEEGLPGFTQMPGYLAAALGVNPARGGALVLIFWDSKQHLHEAEPLADQARSAFARGFKTSDPYRNDSLEIIFATDVLTLDGGLVSPYIHLARFGGLTDEAAERMTDTCVENARLDAGERGSEGALIGVDRGSGTLVKIGFWESMRDMRGVQREYTGSVPGVEEPYTDSFEVVIARDLDRLPRTEPQSPSLAD